MLYRIANLSKAACSLDGYPSVSLSASDGTTMPFAYRKGGGGYVTLRRPVRILIGPAGQAWFLIAKYRCDTGEATAARTSRIRIPGLTRTWTASATEHRGSSGLALCTNGQAHVDPDDPGNTVSVSPIVRMPSEAGG